jgi:hypothetical protein
VIPAPVAAEHPQATPAVAKSGGRVVQLGSLPSHAEAEKEWRRITAKMPALFSGHAPRIISVEVNGHTMYRLRTDGFANRDDAASFCAEVRDRHVRCELR